jgi:hypothetical protein
MESDKVISDPVYQPDWLATIVSLPGGDLIFLGTSHPVQQNFPVPPEHRGDVRRLSLSREGNGRLCRKEDNVILIQGQITGQTRGKTTHVKIRRNR